MSSDVDVIADPVPPGSTGRGRGGGKVQEMLLVSSFSIAQTREEGKTVDTLGLTMLLRGILNPAASPNGGPEELGGS